jgi:hypothetical protein
MAVCGSRMVIRDPQRDPRVNQEVDLNAGDEPVHCSTVRAVTGQIIAVVQVRDTARYDPQPYHHV